MTKDEKLAALKKVQLDLLRLFIQVCEREGLDYYAMFGTMIGAVRHGGFIPWDDDIDVAMPRADYDKLRGMSESFTKPYFLQTPENDPGSCPKYMRLMNLETTYIPQSYPNWLTSGGHYGCRIDILPLDDVPNERAALELADEAEECKLNRYKRAPFTVMTEGDMPDWKREFCHISPPRSYDELTRQYHEICTRYSGRGANFYTVAVAGGDHRGLLLDKKHFETAGLMDFEDMKIRVPVGYAELAEAIYEDGAMLPDEAERESKHEGYYDTENPYTSYTARYEHTFRGLLGKKILLFGAGNMLGSYMDSYGEKYPPVCTFDNDPGKWGKVFCGVTVKNPKELPDLIGGDTAVVIINAYHREIGKQLRRMGIYDYRVYVDGYKYDTFSF